MAELQREQHARVCNLADLTASARRQCGPARPSMAQHGTAWEAHGEVHWVVHCMVCRMVHRAVHYTVSLHGCRRRTALRDLEAMSSSLRGGEHHHASAAEMLRDGFDMDEPHLAFLLKRQVDEQLKGVGFPHPNP